MSIGGLFQLGSFLLHSGTTSNWKIDCDRLTNGDIQTLAAIIHQLVGPFYNVQGIPNGGLRLAKALDKYVVAPQVKEAADLLLVDDVLTTGRSMEEYREAARKIGSSYIKGAALFSRGSCPHWILPLFSTPKELWVSKM